MPDPSLTLLWQNHQPLLLRTISEHVPSEAVVLELDCDAVQAALFSVKFPRMIWQPATRSSRFNSLQRWCRRSPRQNVLPPLLLDAQQEWWPVKQMDAIFSHQGLESLNWQHHRHLLQQIHQVLKPKGVALLYTSFVGSSKPLEAFLQLAQRELLRLRQCIPLAHQHCLIVLEKTSSPGRSAHDPYNDIGFLVP